MIDIGTLYAKVDADTRGLKKAQSDISSFAKKAGVVLAGAFGVRAMSDAVKNVTMASARYDTLGAAMYTVGQKGGYTTHQLDQQEQTLRETGISMIKSRENITRMVQAQIDLSHASDLARIAQDAAVIANLDSSETYSRLINGIQRGETELLKTIGINVSFEDSYKKMAKQLGISATELTVYEKTQARANSVMKAGEDIAGSYLAALDTPLKKLGSLRKEFSNTAVVLGRLFTPTFNTVVDKITSSIKAFQKSMDAETIKRWGDNLNGAVQGTFDFAEGINELSKNLGTPGIGQLGVLSGVMYQFGPRAAIAAGGVSLLNEQFERMNQSQDTFRFPSIESAGRSYKESADAFQNIIDALSGKRDINTGELFSEIDQIRNKITDLEKLREKLTTGDGKKWYEFSFFEDVSETKRKIGEVEKTLEGLRQKLPEQLIIDAAVDFESSSFWKDGEGGWIDALVISDEVKSQNKGTLDRLEKQYTKYVEKIKEISQDLEDNQMRGELSLGDMKRSGMSDYSAWKDLRKEANEYAAAAREAISAGNYDKAVQLAQIAEGQFSELNRKIESDYQQHVDRMKQIGEQLISNQMRGQQRLREMSRSQMDDAGQWKDIKKEANEYAQIARSAAGAGNLERAVEYARMAEDKYASLNREVKNGEKVAVSSSEAFRAAHSGVKGMIDLENTVLAKMKAVEAAQAKAAKPKVSEKDALNISMDGVAMAIEMQNEAIGQMKALEEKLAEKTMAEAQRLSGEAQPFENIATQAEAAQAKVNEFKSTFESLPAGLPQDMVEIDGEWVIDTKSIEAAQKEAKQLGGTMDAIKLPAEQLGQTIQDSMTGPTSEWGAGFDTVIEKINILEEEAKTIADSLPELDFSSDEFDVAIERLGEIDKMVEELTKGQVDLLDNKFLEVWEDGGEAANQALEQIANNFDISISKADRLLQIMREIAASGNGSVQLSGGGAVGYQQGGMIGSFPALKYMEGGAIPTANPIALGSYVTAVQAFHDGGALGNVTSYVKAQSGRHFPGFGGGDKIRILGEAGEVMLNKFAVRDAGVETALAFNDRDWETVQNNLSTKMQSGGYVGSTSHINEQKSNEVPMDLHFPGESEPVSIRAEQRQARRILKAWKNAMDG